MGERAISKRPIEDFCCQNEACPQAGVRGAGNLCWHGFGGRRKDIRILYCRACKKMFSERRGTPLWRCSLPEDKALSVLDHVRDGCGTRGTSRLVGVHRDTVTRLARMAGPHAEELHEELVAVSPSDH